MATTIATAGPGRRVSTTKLVLVASLSALYFVFRLIPTFPNLGVPGATFKAGDMVAPLYGIILGPVLGPLAVIIGTLLGFIGAPPIFLGFDFLPAVACTMIVGLAIQGKRMLGAILYLALILLFLVLPYTSILIVVGGYGIPFVWLHLVGLAIYISPLTGRAVRLVTKDWTQYAGKAPGYLSRQFSAVLVLALSGTLAQHIMGGILTEFVTGLHFNALPGPHGRYSTWQAFWTVVFWAYPFERTIIALVAAGLGASALVALKVSKLAQRLPT
jgi:hypothetical protein